MENNIFKNKLFLFIFSVFFIFLIILAFLSFYSKKQDKAIIVDNIDSYIANLPSTRKEAIQEDLYSYIVKQNEINGIENKNIYHGVVRENTARTNSIETEKNTFSSEFILDIPELQYSYQAQFFWVDNNDYTDPDLNLGSISIYCLSSEESIYPDFNCSRNPAVSTKSDPLMSLNLIINKDCWMSPFSSVESKSGSGITIFYHPTTADYEQNTIMSSYNTCVKTAKNFLSSNGVKLENYKILSEIKYLYNY